MQDTATDTRIKEVISVGAAYQPLRDTREILSSLFTAGMVALKILDKTGGQGPDGEVGVRIRIMACVQQAASCDLNP